MVAASIDRNAYLCALDRIESSLYGIHGLSVLSHEGTTQAVRDVVTAIELLRKEAKEKESPDVLLPML